MQTRSIQSTELFKIGLSDYAPEANDNMEVTISLVEASPGTSPVHYHPGHSFTYVLAGTQLHESADGQKVVHAGDVLYDAPEQIHRTENDALVRLLIVRILRNGEPEITIVE